MSYTCHVSANAVASAGGVSKSLQVAPQIQCADVYVSRRYSDCSTIHTMRLDWKRMLAFGGVVLQQKATPVGDQLSHVQLTTSIKPVSLCQILCIIAWPHLQSWFHQRQAELPHAHRLSLRKQRYCLDSICWHMPHSDQDWQACAVMSSNYPIFGLLCCMCFFAVIDQSVAKDVITCTNTAPLYLVSHSKFSEVCKLKIVTWPDLKNAMVYLTVFTVLQKYWMLMAFCTFGSNLWKVHDAKPNLPQQFTASA